MYNRAYLLFIMPIESAGLGLMIGSATYVFLMIFTSLSSNQRLLALIIWPIIFSVVALFWGIKEYRLLSQGNRTVSSCTSVTSLRW